MIQHLGGGRVKDHGPQKPYTGSRSIIGGTSLAAAIVSRLSPNVRSETDRQRDQRRLRARRTGATVPGRGCVDCGEWLPKESFYVKRDGKLAPYCRPCWSERNRKAHEARRRAGR